MERPSHHITNTYIEALDDVTASCKVRETRLEPAFLPQLFPQSTSFELCVFQSFQRNSHMKTRSCVAIDRLLTALRQSRMNYCCSSYLLRLGAQAKFLHHSCDVERSTCPNGANCGACALFLLPICAYSELQSTAPIISIATVSFESNVKKRGLSSSGELTSPSSTRACPSNISWQSNAW